MGREIPSFFAAIVVVISTASLVTVTSRPSRRVAITYSIDSASFRSNLLFLRPKRSRSRIVPPLMPWCVKSVLSRAVKPLYEVSMSCPSFCNCNKCSTICIYCTCRTKSGDDHSTLHIGCFEWRNGGDIIFKLLLFKYFSKHSNVGILILVTRNLT